MPSKQFGTTYTTEGRRKMGVHLAAGVNACDPKLKICVLQRPLMLTCVYLALVFLTSFTSDTRITGTALQELRQTLIPDHSGYVGAPPQSSSPSAHSIPQSKISHRTAGASPVKAQSPMQQSKPPAKHFSIKLYTFQLSSAHSLLSSACSSSLLARASCKSAEPARPCTLSSKLRKVLEPARSCFLQICRACSPVHPLF
ncbi:hypothetical protein CRG98_007707 [Punica granatum]|uniref:Uncharacterized protein n=1 Tax=Punica granatum TaxID=22663 RepID=A0A2I0KTV9_PUNGR|nr:hypothetical protein CRG98_007707 [Punica granatum]